MSGSQSETVSHCDALLRCSEGKTHEEASVLKSNGVSFCFTIAVALTFYRLSNSGHQPHQSPGSMLQIKRTP